MQIVTRRGRAVERVEHLGSARTDAELALLLAAAQKRLQPGQAVLDLAEVPVVAPRLDDVADWTNKSAPSAGQAMLDDAPAAAWQARWGRFWRPCGGDLLAGAMAGADRRVSAGGPGLGGR